MKTTNRLFGSLFSHIVIFIPIITILFVSCVTQHNVEYLQDKNKTAKAFTESQIEDYRLKPNDELFIQIRSLDDEQANVFSGVNSQTSNNSGNMQPYAASLLSYSVDKEGNLQLPLIGSLSVKDKTISQVNEMIKKSLSNILSQPIISIKLVNRYVSVLGEVRNPGHFAYAQDKLTVYDAISLAGDVTDYGNRKSVLLIRNENNKNIRINLDLTQSELLESNYYNLRPNDMIYVKPLRRKFWGLRQFPYTVILSTITTTLLILNFIEL